MYLRECPNCNICPRFPNDLYGEFYKQVECPMCHTSFAKADTAADAMDNWNSRKAPPE